MKNGISAHTEIIVKEASRRGIKVVTMENINRNIAVLELGGHREMICQSCSNQSGGVTYKVFANKALATAMLEQLGFSVPDTIFTDNVDEIMRFLKKHRKVVIKPNCGVQGAGVSPNLTNKEQVVKAVELARAQKSSGGERRVVCQKHIDGHELRLLVLDKKIVHAVQRFAAQVMGDGASSVEQLIKEKNSGAPQGRKVKLGKEVQRYIGGQGLSWSDVPAKGRKVSLAAAVNAHLGGTVVDVTDEIMQSVKKEAIRVAKLFDALVVGIDCITPDIKTCMGKIIELNSVPDLTLHLNPTQGRRRNPAKEIVDMLFPETISNSLNLNRELAHKG